MRLRLGTRGSALARAQAGLVGASLEAAHPGLTVELVFIRTTGDQMQRGSLAAAGGKGLFLKEIEDALVAGTVDFAVHSMKDVPVALAPGCVLAAVPARADPRDVLVARTSGGISGLAARACVGTASVRRRAQLLARRRDLDVVVLRGNVDTRLARWRAGELDAIVLAAAGLARLGLVVPEAQPVSVTELVPAVGQGALALECRADAARTRALLAAVDDAPAATAMAAERGFLAAIGGDCNTPIAAHAVVEAETVTLRVQVSDLLGERWLDDEASAPVTAAGDLGRGLAERLLARGAADLLGGR
ncbi:MAG: hydroxymethylbilane synthase [Candidatus Binatia bacterium]